MKYFCRRLRGPVAPLLKTLGALSSPRYWIVDGWLARKALRLVNEYVVPPRRSVDIRISRASPPVFT